jgi:putative sigma-54 modulation protein
MSLNIRTKDITLNDATKAHINGALESFKKFGLELTTVNVMIGKEKNGVNIEFDIHIAHAQPIVISQADKDLDTAIDLAIDRASKALRRLHDKTTSKQKTSIKEVETLDA